MCFDGRSPNVEFDCKIYHDDVLDNDGGGGGDDDNDGGGGDDDHDGGGGGLFKEDGSNPG